MDLLPLREFSVDQLPMFLVGEIANKLPPEHLDRRPDAEARGRQDLVPLVPVGGREGEDLHSEADHVEGGKVLLPEAIECASGSKEAVELSEVVPEVGADGLVPVLMVDDVRAHDERVAAGRVEREAGEATRWVDHLLHSEDGGLIDLGPEPGEVVRELVVNRGGVVQDGVVVELLSNQGAVAQNLSLYVVAQVVGLLGRLGHGVEMHVVADVVPRAGGRRVGRVREVQGGGRSPLGCVRPRVRVAVLHLVVQFHSRDRGRRLESWKSEAETCENPGSFLLS